MILTILLLLLVGSALLMETAWHPCAWVEAVGLTCIIAFLFLAGYYVFANGIIPVPNRFSGGM